MYAAWAIDGGMGVPYLKAKLRLKQYTLWCWVTPLYPYPVETPWLIPSIFACYHGRVCTDWIPEQGSSSSYQCHLSASGASSLEHLPLKPRVLLDNGAQYAFKATASYNFWKQLFYTILSAVSNDSSESVFRYLSCETINSHLSLHKHFSKGPSKLIKR